MNGSGVIRLVLDGEPLPHTPILHGKYRSAGVAYCVCGFVCVGVGVQQTARHGGRAVLADLVGVGCVGLVGAGFSCHGENVNVALPCFDGVDDRPLVVGEVG